MNKPLLIIISGPSCTGKTTLAKNLSQKFKLPLITKDSIKEILFDDLGWSNRQWSQKVGTASYSLIHYFLDSFMPFTSSLIIESNFKAEFETKEILSRLKKYDYFPIQIMCQSDGQVLFERFKARSESGQRHPGHCDTSNYDELKPLLLKGKFEPMKIGGKILIFDSTDLKNLKYNYIFNEIKKFI
ncbi:MAG: AAA family ATPase [Candidatus Shapirobacteria bacterium]|nr:AAA family ATPase [Candidatus Shapirobacteria bacterium]